MVFRQWPIYEHTLIERSESNEQRALAGSSESNEHIEFEEDGLVKDYGIEEDSGDSVDTDAEINNNDESQQATSRQLNVDHNANKEVGENDTMAQAEDRLAKQIADKILNNLGVTPGVSSQGSIAEAVAAH